VSTSSPTIGWPVPPARRLDPDFLPRSAHPSALLRDIELRDLALDRIRHGLCVFDPQQRLLLFNRRYAEMYNIDPCQLWIGMSLRDVVDLRYAAGTGPDMPPEQYAAWRDRIGVAEKVTYTEVTLRNGRVYAIHHEPTTGGGWVAKITEGLLLHDTAATLATLTHLRALGIGIALDDFGTGYSSLSYLRRFPFSKLKVDRSFVAGMAADAGAIAIVQAMATLGRSLSIRVSIEGIETEAQLDLLRAMECDEGQGYLFGRPCPAEAFERLVSLEGALVTPTS
jgi:PAS domain-containing protein